MAVRVGDFMRQLCQVDTGRCHEQRFHVRFQRKENCLDLAHLQSEVAVAHPRLFGERVLTPYPVFRSQGLSFQTCCLST